MVVGIGHSGDLIPLVVFSSSHRTHVGLILVGRVPKGHDHGVALVGGASEPLLDLVFGLDLDAAVGEDSPLRRGEVAEELVIGRQLDVGTVGGVEELAQVPPGFGLDVGEAKLAGAIRLLRLDPA